MTVPKLQLVCLLHYSGKCSLDLRARLRRAVENFVGQKLFLDLLADLIPCLDSNISLRKIYYLEYSTTIYILTASLLSTEKFSDIFSFGHMNASEL